MSQLIQTPQALLIYVNLKSKM